MDCEMGEYCLAEEGCDQLGICAPIPGDIACAAVMTPYCDCDGETQWSTSGCIWDRYLHQGACESI